MRPSRNLLLVTFFLGLVVLEIIHGASRIDSLRTRRAEELLAAVTLRHRQLAEGLRPHLESARQHTDYLARLQSTRDLLLRAGEPGISEEFGRRFLPFLVSFLGVDRVRLLDGAARELFRCQRNGDSVANLPPVHLSRTPDEVVRDLGSQQ